MSFGLVGAHRVGKTTLAIELSRELGIPFLETKVTEVFDKLGYNVRKDYDFGTRLVIQEAILDHCIEQYTGAGEFITDRTPLDFLMYTMADITREAVNEDQAEAFGMYFNRCLKATDEHFSLVVLLQPGIPLVDAAKSAQPDEAYIEHLNIIAKGLFVDDSFTCNSLIMQRHITDIDVRLGAIIEAISNLKKELVIFTKEMKRH